MQCAADFLWNYYTTEVVNSTDNTGCFHINLPCDWYANLLSGANYGFALLSGEDKFGTGAEIIPFLA